MWRRHQVEQRDLQGNVLCGYGNEFSHVLYLFVKVRDEGAGRAWLRKLAGQVTNAVPWDGGHKPLSTLNVALTHKGLKHIGVPKAIRKTFPDEFRQGMGKRRRARLLGDVGVSDPDCWDEGLKPGRPDVLVTVTAQDREVLMRRRRALREDIDRAENGLEMVHEQQAGVLDHEHPDLAYRREHFGFADGFSQPAIRGNAGPNTRNGMGTPRALGRWSPVAPGEFVLGYHGEDGLLPAAPVEPLGRNGSFMVVRKLHQDVRRFTSYLEQEAGRSYVKEAVARKLSPRAAADAEVRKQWLAGQIVGRWQDGRALAVSGDPRFRDLDTSALQPDRINRFRYGADADGYRCPVGAHVRRANPRDSLGWHGQLTRRHRIIRRGVPYGPPGADDRPRGLMFVCFQASIARQFEVIQARWLNDGDAFWLGGDKDFPGAVTQPSAGLDDGGEAATTRQKLAVAIEGGPPLLIAAPRKPFVTTKGGGYFFVPGLTALRALASACWR